MVPQGCITQPESLCVWKDTPMFFQKVHPDLGLRCHLISYLRQKVGNRDEGSHVFVASVWSGGRKELPWDADFLGKQDS